MSIIKNKSFWLMLFLFIFGAVFRLAYVNKPEGLWNDEYVSWAIASIPIGKKFFAAMFAQCHMPLYYFYLKSFIHLYGNSDSLLRLTSVIPGILSIISMYFVGKEFKSKNLGILAAAVTSISSFLIYYSLEVRFYSLLFFFSSLALLFTIKLGKKQSRANYFWFVVSNLFIILTHSIGFVFVIFNLIFISMWMFRSNPALKKSIVITWSSLTVLTLLNLPLMIKIFTTHSLSQWWGHFTLSKIGFLLTDYFSPVLTNLVNAPDSFFANMSLGFVIFAILPSIIAIWGIVRALMTKDFRVLGLFYVSVAYLIMLIFAAITGKLVFLTKYSIEIYPILIILMCFGLLELKQVLRMFLIFVFCFFNVFYLYSYPLSAPRLPRNEGHKLVANLLKNSDLKQGDVVLLTYYDKDRFEKYYDFKNLKVYTINKNNFYNYLNIPFDLLSVNDNRKFKALFNSESNDYFNKEFNKNVLKNLSANHKISVVFLNDVSMYSPTQMDFISKNPKIYSRIPFPFLAFSQIKNDIFKECTDKLNILRVENIGSWTVMTFKSKKM